MDDEKKQHRAEMNEKLQSQIQFNYQMQNSAQPLEECNRKKESKWAKYLSDEEN